MTLEALSTYSRWQ